MRKTRSLEIIVVLIGLCLLAGVFGPAIFCRVRESGPHGPSCLSNLKQLGLGLQQYSQDFHGRYPWRVGVANPDDAWLDLGMLFPNYVSGFKSFFCRSANDRPFDPMCALGSKHDCPLEPLLSSGSQEVISYAYGIDARDPSKPTSWTEEAPWTVRVLADKKAGVGLDKRSNHGLDGRYVLYNDCHVKWKPGHDALDPDQDDDAVGPPNATEYTAWWSDPPYRGE